MLNQIIGAILGAAGTGASIYGNHLADQGRDHVVDMERQRQQEFQNRLNEIQQHQMQRNNFDVLEGNRIAHQDRQVNAANTAINTGNLQGAPSVPTGGGSAEFASALAKQMGAAQQQAGAAAKLQGNQFMVRQNDRDFARDNSNFNVYDDLASHSLELLRDEQDVAGDKGKLWRDLGKLGTLGGKLSYDKILGNF